MMNVSLVNSMKSDPTIETCIKVSFDLTANDKKFIRFLAKNDQTSIFRYAMLPFEN